MSFVSVRFLLFFPIAALIYWVLPKRARALWLLAASYYFYACWQASFALLMAFCTLVAYGGALAMDRTEAKAGKRLWLLLCAGVCLCILTVFKYAGFIADTFHALGLAGQRHFSVVVPLGISFYTFQALGYLIDVYRGKIPAEKNILRLALFVSFFPQLAAGPIERAGALLPQLFGDAPFDWLRVRRGLLRMCWGFFEKLVIADRLAVAVDAVFAAEGSVSGSTAAAAGLLFAVQIYADFAGYCEIAIGSADIMGITLSENFRQPYLALGMTDYWRRWHITLNDWFRRYVYAPLAASRPARGLYRRQSERFGRKMAARLSGVLPALIVWLFTGLWHGAAWSFVLWGLWHGLFCILEGVGLIPAGKLKKTLPGRLALRLYLLAVVLPGALVFRAGSAAVAFSMLSNLTRPGPVSIPGLSAAERLAALAALFILLLVDFSRERAGPARIETAPLPLRWTVYLLLILAVVIFGVYGPGYDAASFIYFQF